nr:MAG TPA: hypothetical protein [Caudoviricetes sp.]
MCWTFISFYLRNPLMRGSKILGYLKGGTVMLNLI